MATGNFYPHENGIFVIEEREYDEVKQFMIEMEHLEEDITDEMVYDEINFYMGIDAEDFLGNVRYELKKLGYDMDIKNDYFGTVYNKKGKLVADIELKSGYYSHVQAIVETDMDTLLENHGCYADNKTEALEYYTPHNKRLFKIIENYTTKLSVYARFSSGETMYTKAS